MEAEGGRNVQRLQAESRRRVREEDGEHLLGVHQELRGVVPVLETILDTQINKLLKPWCESGEPYGVCTYTETTHTNTWAEVAKM